MPVVKLHKTVGVRVGSVQVGGGAPVVVQSMTMTDTADAAATAAQCIELAEAGSEMVRVTVNLPEAAAAVPEIKQRMLDAGVTAPLIGDFHYNGHLLLTRHPDCARHLDKYRINPGNVGTGKRRDEQFSTICKVARDQGKPVRIGVNGGSLNQELVVSRMQENTDRDLGLTSEEIINECMVLSAVQSTELAIESGLRKDQIIISCKTSRPRDLIAVYRDLSRKTEQPLHLGLTEAGMGMKGLVWSAASMGVLLNEGIGDTIRVSLTPRPGGDRRDEVYAACELLQALGLRTFAPSVTACPGCGRTTSSTFQELAERTQEYIRERMPEWKTQYRGCRSDDARRDGMRRERTRGIEGGEHRYQPAGHGRGAELPGFRRRPALHNAARHVRRAVQSIPGAGRQLRFDQIPPQGRLTAQRQSIRLTISAPFSWIVSCFKGPRVRRQGGCRVDPSRPCRNQRHAADNQAGRQPPPQADHADAYGEAQDVSKWQAYEPVPRQVPDHRRTRIAEAAQYAGGDCLQAIEQLKECGDHQQRHADLEDVGIGGERADERRRQQQEHGGRTGHEANCRTAKRSSLLARRLEDRVVQSPARHAPRRPSLRRAEP